MGKSKNLFKWHNLTTCQESLRPSMFSATRSVAPLSKCTMPQVELLPSLLVVGMAMTSLLLREDRPPLLPHSPRRTSNRCMLLSRTSNRARVLPLQWVMDPLEPPLITVEPYQEATEWKVLPKLSMSLETKLVEPL